MHRFESQPAFILHTRLYRETSLLLEVFTEEYGRIGMIAKGIRKPNIRSRGLLQPFIPLLVAGSGRGELLALKNVEASGVPPFLEGRRLVCAFYLNELLMRLLHRFDPYPELFALYDKALRELEKAKEEQIILRLFEKSLLKNLGYELQLLKEVETGSDIDPEALYRFDPVRGPILVESLAQESHSFFKGRSLLALAEEKLNTMTVLGDAKRLMRQALAYHLGNKPLESGKLL